MDSLQQEASQTNVSTNISPGENFNSETAHGVSNWQDEESRANEKQNSLVIDPFELSDHALPIGDLLLRNLDATNKNIFMAREEGEPVNEVQITNKSSDCIKMDNTVQGNQKEIDVIEFETNRQERRKIRFQILEDAKDQLRQIKESEDEVPMLITSFVSTKMKALEKEMKGLRLPYKENSVVGPEKGKRLRKNENETKSCHRILKNSSFHYCTVCKDFSPDLNAYLDHLHHAKHLIKTKLIAPESEESSANDVINILTKMDAERNPDVPVAYGQSKIKNENHMGEEFVEARLSFHCTLCKVTFESKELCKEHIRSEWHQEVFEDCIKAYSFLGKSLMRERCRALKEILKRHKLYEMVAYNKKNSEEILGTPNTQSNHDTGCEVQLVSSTEINYQASNTLIKEETPPTYSENFQRPANIDNRIHDEPVMSTQLNEEKVSNTLINEETPPTYSEDFQRQANIDNRIDDEPVISTHLNEEKVSHTPIKEETPPTYSEDFQRQANIDNRMDDEPVISTQLNEEKVRHTPINEETTPTYSQDFQRQANIDNRIDDEPVISTQLNEETPPTYSEDFQRQANIDNRMDDEPVISTQLNEEKVSHTPINEETPPTYSEDFQRQANIDNRMDDEPVISTQLNEEKVIHTPINEETTPTYSQDFQRQANIDNRIDDEPVISTQLNEEKVRNTLINEETAATSSEIFQLNNQYSVNDHCGSYPDISSAPHENHPDVNIRTPVANSVTPIEQQGLVQFHVTNSERCLGQGDPNHHLALNNTVHDCHSGTAKRSRDSSPDTEISKKQRVSNVQGSPPSEPNNIHHVGFEPPGEETLEKITDEVNQTEEEMALEGLELLLEAGF